MNLEDTLHMKAYAGYTPLLTAVFYGAKECVEYLLKV
jgi:ankyrin repeat protein